MHHRRKRTSNPAVQRTGARRFAQIPIERQRRLVPTADAELWAASVIYATILLPCHDLPCERLPCGRAALSDSLQTIFVAQGRPVYRPCRGHESFECEAGFSNSGGV